MKRENSTLSLMKNRQGRTSVETITTMLLILLMGAGLFALTLSTVNAYQRLNTAKENATELRIASSFVTTKIRQNDMTGCLDVIPNSLSGENALVIYETLDGKDYATWIFHYRDRLWEALVLREETPTLEVSQAVAGIDSFSVTYDPGEQGFMISLGKAGQEDYSVWIKTRTTIGERY